MMKGLHAANSSQTPANGTKAQEGFFGNTPCLFFRLLFVHPEQTEGNKVNHDKIYYQINHIIPLNLGKADIFQLSRLLL